MSVAMAIWAQGDTVPDPIAFLHPEDVVYIQEASIALYLLAACTFTDVCASKHRAANLMIAFDLRTHDRTTFGAVAAKAP
ncbi:hypothetical protein BMUNKI379_21750 [Burkholderia multivorans]|nr:hypothetical protein BMUNKI379_21750 [Burkholderia multivorans]